MSLTRTVEAVAPRLVKAPGQGAFSQSDLEAGRELAIGMAPTEVAQPGM